MHGSANPFFKFSVPCWAKRKIWNWHLFRFYWNFIIWRRQIIFALKNNGKISKNCQNSRSPCFFSWVHKSYTSITKITQYPLFTVLCYLFPKKDEQNLTSVSSFLFFRKKKHKKRKMKFGFRFIVFPFMYKQKK